MNDDVKASPIVFDVRARIVAVGDHDDELVVIFRCDAGEFSIPFIRTAASDVSDARAAARLLYENVTVRVILDR